MRVICWERYYMHCMCVCVWNYVNLLFCCYDVEQIASNISKISTKS